MSEALISEQMCISRLTTPIEHPGNLTDKIYGSKDGDKQ